ncbi:MAG: C4-type zinc ribbon domain-containing protein [Candidatus Cloacimonetes bacterium]|nr:C4-type zinc ribbon domain-containing protein [Candidatus Cloacimonadota bacterium]
MKLELSFLIKMQKIDDKITELEIVKEKLPKQLEQLVQNVKKTQDLLAAVDKKLEINALQQKTKESEIKANNEIKLKYSHQLEGIKNNKEYKALNSQICNLTDKNALIETDILKFLDEETTLKKQKTEALTLNKKANENLKANEDVLKKEIEKVNKEIDKLKENRLSFAKQVSEPNVKKYIQLIKNKNRKAVVFSHNSACSGCGFHIRPQILIELNNPVKMIYCENCGRILVKSFEE